MRVGDRVALVAASGPLPLDVLAAGVAKLAG